MTDRISIAADLEALLSGTLNAAAFLAKHKVGNYSDVRDAIWENLHHYLDDADIRARDESYRQMQDTELGKLIRLLRENAPLADLRRITFLSRT
jgi:hypothetical protein